MSFQRHALRLVSLLLVLGWSGIALAQPGYLLAPLGPPPGGSGGQLQIGTGLPLPIGPPGIFLGGMVLGSAGPPFWPPLFLPDLPRRLWLRGFGVRDFLASPSLDGGLELLVLSAPSPVGSGVPPAPALPRRPPPARG